jgi:hypothetical protein
MGYRRKYKGFIKIDLSNENFHIFSRVTIIPGNRYFGLEEERGIFHQLLPLED